MVNFRKVIKAGCFKQAKTPLMGLWESPQCVLVMIEEIFAFTLGVKAGIVYTHVGIQSGKTHGPIHFV